MVKFGLNSSDAMDEFRYIVNHGQIRNPTNGHPFPMSCFLADHTRPMHGAQAKPTVDLPQMLVNNVPLPDAYVGEIPDRNIALANVPEWTSSVQVNLVADEIHGNQLATCKPQLKVLFNVKSWQYWMKTYTHPLLGTFILQGSL